MPLGTLYNNRKYASLRSSGVSAIWYCDRISFSTSFMRSSTYSLNTSSSSNLVILCIVDWLLTISAKWYRSNSIHILLLQVRSNDTNMPFRKVSCALPLSALPNERTLSVISQSFVVTSLAIGYLLALIALFRLYTL